MLHILLDLSVVLCPPVKPIPHFSIYNTHLSAASSFLERPSYFLARSAGTLGQAAPVDLPGLWQTEGAAWLFFLSLSCIGV